MHLQKLYSQLADVFDGPEIIETRARQALQHAAESAFFSGEANDLQQPFLDVVKQPHAHPVCRLIAQASLPWAPPQTSASAKYIEDS